MTISMTPFLRNALHADAAFSAVGAILMAGGASLVASFTDLPAQLLLYAGLILIPYVLLLVFVARKPAVSRLAIVDIIAINALWVAASFGLLASGYITPNWLGVAFVVAQALAVALFGLMQFVGLRRADMIAATR